MEIFDTLARHWNPGIGDPTAMGWLTVVAYFATAVLLLWKRRLSVALFPSHWREHRRILLVLALVMIALGINKQLDLQTYLTDVGRDLAETQSWYEHRRVVQAVALAGILAVGAGLAFAIWRMKGVLRPHRLALVGLLLLVVFVAMRASSFFKMDRLIGFEFAGLKVNWILELGAIGVVAWSVVTSLLTLRRERRRLRDELARAKTG